MFDNLDRCLWNRFYYIAHTTEVTLKKGSCGRKKTSLSILGLYNNLCIIFYCTVLVYTIFTQ